MRVGGAGRRAGAGSVSGVGAMAGVHAGRWQASGRRTQRRSRVGRCRRPTALRRPVPRQSLEALTAGMALKNHRGARHLMNQRGQGLARRAGSQRRVRRLPNHASGGAARREIAGGAAPSMPGGRFARGITCPPPGVNRDPPALAPAGTFGPEVDHSSRAAAALRDLTPRSPHRARVAALDRHPTQRRKHRPAGATDEHLSGVCQHL